MIVGLGREFQTQYIKFWARDHDDFGISRIIGKNVSK